MSERKLNPMQAGMKPQVLVLMSGRAFPESTEVFLYVDTELTEFWLAHGPKGNDRPIGYVRYVRRSDEVVAGVSQGIFELTELLLADSPCPGPIISLSGVLWTRHAIPEVGQAR